MDFKSPFKDLGDDKDDAGHKQVFRASTQIIVQGRQFDTFSYQ
ncbi:MAG TPA: hypothetical protein VFM65_10380 [Flavobacteriaceae bacterium]|nr:hypothetical protein [Flavobacteriaceae bacterium]